eukprot:TRINITY_DN23030_c0_g1_i1.p1 TRINITY_DN23030_c0_g1~~TRINITY_DN23030_c0_g1_i1.p1  ORF type:complete len:141 (+),score=24.35 TRINITY_DN23030_c0_g1_i1:85-507(+)
MLGAHRWRNLSAGCHRIVAARSSVRNSRTVVPSSGAFISQLRSFRWSCEQQWGRPSSAPQVFDLRYNVVCSRRMCAKQAGEAQKSETVMQKIKRMGPVLLIWWTFLWAAPIPFLYLAAEALEVDLVALLEKTTGWALPSP